MFSRSLRPVVAAVTRKGGKASATTQHRFFKVMVAGGAGGIGQPMGLLLRLNPLVTNLALYDLSPVTYGVAVDLSHMDTSTAKVKGYMGPKELDAAVKDAHVVVILAGKPSVIGMSREKLFETNSSIIRNLVLSVCKHAPKAVVNIVTNPVNALVPVACEVMKKAGVFDPNRVLGCNMVDVVRACAFIGEINKVHPSTVNIPIIGGHSDGTIIPLLSQCKPPVKLTSQEDIKKLTRRIEKGGDEVKEAKAGGGSATLSMAWAATRLSNAVLKGLNGEPNVIECAYVKSDVSEAPYFANPLLFGKNGVEKNLGYGKLNQFESKLLKKAIPILIKHVKTGEDYVKNSR